MVRECDMRIAFGLGHTLLPDSVGAAPTGRRLNGVGAVDAKDTESTSYPQQVSGACVGAKPGLKNKALK